MRKIILIMCLICALAFLAACAEDTGSEQTTTAAGDGTGTGDTDGSNGYDEETGHVFPDVDFGGAAFVILNNEPIWDFTTAIVPEEQTGEVLNDAKWRRNTYINERFNIELEERAIPLGEINGRIRTAVRAGDQDFDSVFCPGAHDNQSVGTLAVSGYLVDLMTVPELNLSSPWWNQGALEDARIGSNSSVFFASNDISIHALQCPWVIYFNTQMIEDLNFESPYQLVREGRWNLDTMETYMRAATNLHEDESFTPFRPAGTAVYGLSTAIPAIGELFRGLDVRYVAKDGNNMPVFAANEPRFLAAAQRLADVLSLPGMHTDGGATHYEIVFMNGRALFVYAEFKAATVYRYSELAFGIVPSPKLDEHQENFVHNLTQQAPVFIIPVTTPDTRKTGIVMDAMAYVSQRDVTPVFFDVHMSQKELRTEESVEMLQIIRDTSIFDIGRIYSWASQINIDIYTDIVRGGGQLASIIERHIDSVNSAIETTIAQLEEVQG